MLIDFMSLSVFEYPISLPFRVLGGMKCPFCHNHVSLSTLRLLLQGPPSGMDDMHYWAQIGLQHLERAL